MKRHTDVLQFANTREKTIFNVEQRGYLFDAETKDGHTVELFVYKRDNVWQVNDTATKSKLHNHESGTRKEAVEKARGLLARVTLERVQETERKVTEVKAGLTKIEVPEGVAK